MIKVAALRILDEDTAAQMETLLSQLSPTPSPPLTDTPWIEDIMSSLWHDQFVARDSDGRVVGMATMSVIFSARHGYVAYLEDFVVDRDCRGQGIGTKIWDTIVAWARVRQCDRLEFTSSGVATKAAAVEFYLHRGAKIRTTNSFRYDIPRK